MLTLSTKIAVTRLKFDNSTPTGFFPITGSLSGGDVVRWTF